MEAVVLILRKYEHNYILCSSMCINTYLNSRSKNSFAYFDALMDGKPDGIYLYSNNKIKKLLDFPHNVYVYNLRNKFETDRLRDAKTRNAEGSQAVHNKNGV